MVAELGAERSGTGHEGAAAAGDFLAAGVEENTIGNVKALGAADHVTASEKMAAGDRAKEIKLEGRSEDEEIGDAGLDGEESGVVESFEVDSTVNGLSRVMEVLADREFQFSATFLGDGEARTEVFVDGRGVVHADESFEMFHGHGQYFVLRV